MSNKLYEETDVQAIANAIRSKNGSSDTYKVSEMAQAVLDIPQGTTPTGTKQIAIDSAGVTTENISAYANVEITVPQGEYKPQLSTTMTPSISVSNSGLITASNLTQVLQDSKEDLTEGYVEASDVSAKATITGGSATHQLQTVSGQTVTPTTSQQEIAVQGDFVTGSLKVGAIPSQYIIPTGTKSISANGTGIDVKAYEFVDVSVSGGSIGGLADMIDVNSQNYQLAYMLMCMKNGDTVGGTVTWTTAFANTEQLLLSTGLTTLHGILFVSPTDDMTVSVSQVQSCEWVLITINSDGTYNAAGWQRLSGSGTNNATAVTGYAQSANKDGSPINGALRFSGGDIYYKARYNKNANYQILANNTQFEWLAW